ncbi:hypothetical protein BpHYR1_031688 [Brachionus plicatilis]|uniref:Uncharacterized protein n=1 Tax=Brachionus plicatilis TaxID=10195 RepID=A0A3M7Q435_BRAPC|nr:hypothetical protein BpHYR1_031688 [Brachionus plicatilis]
MSFIIFINLFSKTCLFSIFQSYPYSSIFRSFVYATDWVSSAFLRSSSASKAAFRQDMVHKITISVGSNKTLLGLNCFNKSEENY